MAKKILTLVKRIFSIIIGLVAAYTLFNIIYELFDDGYFLFYEYVIFLIVSVFLIVFLVLWNIRKSKYVYFLLFIPVSLVCGYIFWLQHYDSEDDYILEINYGGAPTITGYIGDKTDLRIPRKAQKMDIWKIGEYSFSNTGLTSVVIPQEIYSIDEYAFANNKLKKINIPNTVRHIFEGAFQSNQLTEVNLSRNLTVIGKNAFWNNQIKKIKIHRGVTSIRDYAFAVNKLESVSIPNSVTHIHYRAFTNNNLTNVIIPNSVTYIGDWAFAMNKLTSVTISSGISEIGNMVFGLNELTSIVIPDNVTSIKNHAFTMNRQLTSISIGSNVIIEEDGGFLFDFAEFYKDMGSRAGLYTYNKGGWTVQFR